MIGPSPLRAMPPLAFIASGYGSRACYKSLMTPPPSWWSEPFQPLRSCRNGGRHGTLLSSSFSSTGEQWNSVNHTLAPPLPVTTTKGQRPRQDQQQMFIGGSDGDVKGRACVLLHGGDDDEGSADCEVIARDLAARLGLPLVMGTDDDERDDDDQPRYSHRLMVVPHPLQRTHAVAIQPTPTNPRRGGRRGRSRRKRGGDTSYQRSKPFFVDFCSDGTDLGRRLSSGDRGGEMLLRAIVPRKQVAPSTGGGILVYDLTAGFGRDSAVIAAASGGDVRRVLMVERDPIVAELLRDGLRRLDLLASSSSSVEPLEGISESSIERARALSGRLELTVGDGVDVARHVADAVTGPGEGRPAVEVPDVCYLDPMFPPRRAGAGAVRKEMQILHGLLRSQSRSSHVRGEEDADEDATEDAFREWRLLEAALGAASKRVVVKRPIHAPNLGSGPGVTTGAPKPSYELRGSTNRFDVYVVGT